MTTVTWLEFAQISDQLQWLASRHHLEPVKFQISAEPQEEWAVMIDGQSYIIVPEDLMEEGHDTMRTAMLDALLRYNKADGVEVGALLDELNEMDE